MDYIDNYILYMDSSYSVKAKGFDGEMNNHFDTRKYVLEGIDTDFFILAVFIDNKRVDGFQFDNTSIDLSYHTDNLFMKSIINDFGMTDLNLIPLNHFLPAYKKVMFQVNRSVNLPSFVDVSLSPPLSVKSLSFYGLVCPTYIVKQHTPHSRNQRTLVVSHRGSENGLTEATIFPYGVNIGAQFVNQFVGLNSDPDDGFQFYPVGSSHFSIDDTYIQVGFMGNQDKFFEFDIETLIDQNIIKLSVSDQYRVTKVQPNANGKTQWEFLIDKLLINSNDADFSFTVAIDWKKLPSLGG
ncbi:hypothetical protein [Flavobacterium salmonis]|uniref:Uncharacterized protein n=1 Tax=Flavobacterium salmonis TaxID=2654844 RepID=A0A6V6Z4R4_9FLAO|nr:hypothetical protein [Flavobacterium salmonis]CAD0006569.1 hypothetical protein FLAT13_03352 [Flavobacterium salmonis]